MSLAASSYCIEKKKRTRIFNYKTNTITHRLWCSLWVLLKHMLRCLFICLFLFLIVIVLLFEVCYQMEKKSSLNEWKYRRNYICEALMLQTITSIVQVLLFVMLCQFQFSRQHWSKLDNLFEFNLFARSSFMSRRQHQCPSGEEYVPWKERLSAFSEAGSCHFVLKFFFV